jgi:hypothetical protein
VEEQEPNPIKSPVAGRQVGVTSRPYHGSRFYEAKTGHSLSLHVRRRPGRSQSLTTDLMDGRRRVMGSGGRDERAAWTGPNGRA